MKPLPRPDAEAAAMLRRFRIAQERRGVLPTSIRRREDSLRSLIHWLEPRSLLEATREDVELFLDGRRTLDGKPLGPKTRYAWISHVHCFFEWAVTEELCAKDPTLTIARPKMRRTLPRPIADDDLALALREAPVDVAAMIALGAYEGLRCQEIAGLDRADVIDSRDPPVLVVVAGKGGHQRVLPLHAEALAALRRLPLPQTGWVFRRPHGDPYTPALLSAKLRRYMHDVGVKATGHQLRHWFGTSIYAATHDIRLTQELLGHQSPNTTAVYVAWAAVDAADAVGSLKIGS